MGDHPCCCCCYFSSLPLPNQEWKTKGWLRVICLEIQRLASSGASTAFLISTPPTLLSLKLRAPFLLVGIQPTSLLGSISSPSPFQQRLTPFQSIFHILPVLHPLREHTDAVFMLILCSLSCVCYSKQLKQLLPVILFLREPPGQSKPRSRSCRPRQSHHSLLVNGSSFLQNLISVTSQTQ